ncbi:hypothetical protein GQ53DRAFT_180454 [Thozetella sp. PMI_491]|nr:hypothetical protein GQ53DRAFT_180454 [Thozetella sp. PMI_491]
MKGHNKSRRGCSRCKERKVKVSYPGEDGRQRLVYSQARWFAVCGSSCCLQATHVPIQCDEATPHCSNCARRRERCSYPGAYVLFLPPEDMPEQPGWPHHESSAPRSPIKTQYDETPSCAADLDLTHQFLTRTFETLWERSEGRIIWRDVIFRTALKCPALLDGILATAAMHRIATEDLAKGDPHLVSTALRKQTSALRGLQSLLQDIGPQTYETIFPLSTLVAYWAFASRSLPAELDILSSNFDIPPSVPAALPPRLNSAVDLFIELLRKIRPMHAVVRESQPWLRQSRLAGLTRVPRHEDLLDLDEDARHALDDLESYFPSLSNEAVSSDMQQPLVSLRTVFRTCASAAWAELVVAWPVHLPEAFIESLKRQAHPELTVVSYWAVCLGSLSARWWVSGWPAALVAEISEIVQGPWAGLVDWPKKRLGL